jgi:hypothetical protein
MKTNNVLDKIKEELRGNAIQPSENAWETMNAMLDAQEEKKSKKKVPIWVYAAAIAGVLFGLTVLFQNNKQDAIDTLAVEKQIIETSKDATDTIVIKKNQNTVEKEVIVVNETPKVKLLNKKNKSVKQKTKHFKTVNTTPISYVQNISDPTKKQEQIATPASPKELKLVATTVKKEKKPLMQSSNSDIDAMLASALGNENTRKTYTLEVAENTLQNTAATKGDMTVNKFLKNVIQTGVDTVEDIISANDN